MARISMSMFVPCGKCWEYAKIQSPVADLKTPRIPPAPGLGLEDPSVFKVEDV